MSQAAPVQFATTAGRALKTKLRAERISMIFNRDGKSTEVLENISLEVGDGEFLCLLGPSGCGKSTMLNTMAGFLSPTRGEVRIDGEQVTVPIRAASSSFRNAACFPG